MIEHTLYLWYRFKTRISREKRLVIAIPYIWMVVFFLIPLFIVAKIGFSQTQVSIPPYTPLVEFGDNYLLKIHLHLGNFVTIFKDNFYLTAFLSSLRIALFSAFSCLIIGYTMAYGIHQSPKHWRPLLVLLVILPFWTSFLIRVYSWMGLLSQEGILNSLLLHLGIIHEPLRLLYHDGAVILGITYCYLPFMILPIYTALEKIDHTLLEAAFDLGCHPLKAFLTITLPLSTPGILAGFTLVFIPAVGEFVIPELLGGAETLLMGRVLWIEFFNNREWPLACALTLALLILFIVPVMVFQKIQLVQGEKD